MYYDFRIFKLFVFFYICEMELIINKMTIQWQK